MVVEVDLLVHQVPEEILMFHSIRIIKIILSPMVAGEREVRNMAALDLKDKLVVVAAEHKETIQ